MAQQTLDRGAFKKQITVLAASVPVEKSSLFLKSQELKGCETRVRLYLQPAYHGAYRSIINIPKTKSIVQDPSDPQKRLLLFRVSEFGQFPFKSGIGCGLMSGFKQADLNEPAQKFLESHDLATTTQDIDLDYDFWNAGEATLQLGPLRMSADCRARGR
jgi:hypothetical protein